MTEGLLAVYPDVFKGGSEFAGVPAGCWAVGNMTDGQWSGSCAGGQVTHTAAEWGTMVKNMYPGYTGFRPRIQLWHGDADTIIRPANQTEAIKQWTNVLGLPTTPTSTMMVAISNHQYSWLVGAPWTWSTATSVALSAPSTLALYVAPGPLLLVLNVTFTDDAPSTTWALV